MAKKAAQAVPAQETLPAVQVNPITLSSVLKIEGKEINMALLKKKQKEASLIVIDGVKDKKNYDLTVKAIAAFRTTRTTLEKVRKEENAPILELLAGRKKLSDDLGAYCAIQEADLDKKITVIDDEKKRLAEIKAKEKQDKIDDRRDRIVAIRYTFFEANGILALPDQSKLINMLQIESFTDEEFEELFEDAELAAAQYDQREAEKATKDELRKVRDSKLITLISQYNFSIPAREEPDTSVISEEEFQAFYNSLELEFETEQKRRDDEAAFNQLVDDRTERINKLHKDYQLPVTFFATTDIAKEPNQKLFDLAFSAMENEAIADKKRRDDDKKELEELRALRNYLPVKGDVDNPFSDHDPVTAAENLANELPVWPEEEQEHLFARDNDITPEIEIIPGRLPDEGIDPLPDAESKNSAAELVNLNDSIGERFILHAEKAWALDIMITIALKAMEATDTYDNIRGKIITKINELAHAEAEQ